MAENEELHFTVLYRGKPLKLKAVASSTLSDLGQEIVDLTGVAPHTLRLMLPKRPPLQPMSDRTTLLSESGIAEGLTMRMMGSSLAEVAAVSHPFIKDRILGFSEEEQRARQRSRYGPSAHVLPKGSYIFCDFQTLLLPGIALSPPPATALKIMHKLASDRGIIAIMSKYHWRIGVMTEMAPIGYVGISPKCILGFNKNRGEEISLRLRTDDLKGFRKYESIKKTLLHELAHMVHDEHDEKFHAFNKQLNEDAIALDWTKAQGHTLSGNRFEDEEEAIDASGVGSSRGYRLGGNPAQTRFMDPRTAAAAAALRRLGDAVKRTPDLGGGEAGHMTASMSGGQVGGQSGPDREVLDDQSMIVIAGGEEVVDAADIIESVPVNSQEPDPDEVRNEHAGNNETAAALDLVLDLLVRSEEPDPDELCGECSGKSEPDPDEAVNIVLHAPARSEEPDPDEASSGDSSKNAPDPDEAVDIVLDAPLGGHEGKNVVACENEPDPDEAVDIFVDAPLRKHEADPDEVPKSGRCRNDPDPDKVPNIAIDAPVKGQEPDPDQVPKSRCGRNEPDPDEAVNIVLDVPLRRHEPDPDAAGDKNAEVRKCCSCMAAKRMKASSGSGNSKLVKSQMSR